MKRLVILFLVTSFPAHAFTTDLRRPVGDEGQYSSSRPPGLSCETLNDFWRLEAHAKLRIDWPLKTFPCPSDNAQLAEALYVLKQISNPSFGPYAELQRRVGRTTRSDARGDSMAAVHSASRVLYLFPSYFASHLEVRVTTLIHENWHFNPSQASHVNCADGINKGEKNACDEDLSLDHGSSDTGAYSIQLAAYLDLARRPKADLFGMDPDHLEIEAWTLFTTRFNRITLPQFAMATDLSKALYCILKYSADDAMKGCLLGRKTNREQVCQTPKLNENGREACRNAYRFKGKTDADLYRALGKAGSVNGI